MHRTGLFIILWALAVLPATPSAAEDAASLPERKPGYWEIKTVMDEGFGPRDQTLTICIDGDMERNTVAASRAEHLKNCSQYDVKKSGDATIVAAQCVFDGRNVESRTEMSGDFTTSFKVKIDSTTSGSERGQSVSVKRTITQDGKYLGANCRGLRAGEAMGTDGHKILVQ
jgi:hypothetical protein